MGRWLAPFVVPLAAIRAAAAATVAHVMQLLTRLTLLDRITD